MSSSARRFRLLLIPVVLIVFGLTFRGSASADGFGDITFKTSAWDLVPQRGRQGLWSYADWTGEPDEVAESTWEWVTKQSYQQAHGYRRPSIGGLKEQGAKKSLYTNMRDDQKYFMTYPTAGQVPSPWNNQVMEIMTGIQIALLSGRTPVIAPFFPLHFNGPAGAITVSDVFDLTRLSMYWDKPMVEAHELKASNELPEHALRVKYDGEIPMDGVQVGDWIEAEEGEDEPLGVWSTALLWSNGMGLRGTFKPNRIESLPMPVNVTHSRPHREHCSLQGTAEFFKKPDLNHPQTLARLAELERPMPTILPTDKFVAVDTVYWCRTDPERLGLHEEWHRGQGAWVNVGIHMRWQPGLERLADDFLRYMFGLRANAELPVFMAIHIRRGDFNEFWKKITPQQYAYKAWEVMNEAAGLGIRPTKVIVTTDEQDPAWLDQLRAYGFIVVDHIAAQTGERLGWWMPTLLDAIMLSKAHVFMGNPSSTMSILAKRRVLDWNNGYSKNMSPFTKVPEGWTWKLQG